MDSPSLMKAIIILYLTFYDHLSAIARKKTKQSVGGNFVRYGTECGKFVGQYDRPVLHHLFEDLYELIADFDDDGAEYPVIGNAYEDPELVPEWEKEENK